nr:uncharacterized protein LOC109120307 [Solanum lycopersicum]
MAFITPWGVYHYRVMPFGLKNVDATYVRAMTTIFHDMIHKEIEVYVDDVIIKSHESSDHLTHLRKFFVRLRRYNLKFNPAKCAFEVPAGKLLGFIVSRRGIELDPSKIKAIQEFPLPKTRKEVMSFLGRLNYISRCITQSTVICEPVFKLLKKDAPTKWTEECQTAFDAIKSYLSNPPLLVPPREGSPLLLYLSVSDSAFGCVLGQHDETGKKEKVIYYISKKFTPYESRYTLLERTCCAVTWLAQKLRHYLSSYTTYLISRMDPLKVIFQKAMPTGKLAKWQMLLSWRLFFDGAANHQGKGVGAVLVSKSGQHYPMVQGEWTVKNSKIVPYVQYVQNLCKRFCKIEFRHTPRIQNELADALATIASMVKHPDTDYIDPLDIDLNEHPIHCSHVESEPDDLPWYFDIKRYLESGTYPEDATSNQKKSIRRMIHAGVCGTHMNGLTLARKVLRAVIHRKSTAYRPQMNRAVEAANKNIKKILRKMIDKQRGWHEMLPYAFLGYRTTVRTSTWATPYLLVYGTEAVVPVEVEIPSLRIIQEAELSNAEWLSKQIDQLALIDKKRIVAFAMASCTDRE